MLDTKELLNVLKEEHSVNTRSDISYAHALVTGIVVDTDDPLQNGRLRIYCPTLNDDPAKLHHLPWAVYISPLAGSISNSSYARGTGKGPENTSGAVAYGWWGIPEQGAKVLVGCIEGDERRRFWIGCIPEHQETHTLFHGRYKWSGGDGTPDGPLSSTDSPIEPQYTNASKAFDGDKDSREWKTRQAEYQATAVDITEGEPPNSSKSTYLDEQYPEISESEQDDWVKAIVGAHGYDWTGNKALGSFKSSRVFGFSTPGGHAISFDDRAYNSRIRIRSATGHQLILDDTNERIYLSSNEGNNWLELDSSGNIDVYAKRRVSVHSEKDINFTTDESFRVKAKKGIYMYAGDTEDQEPLDDEKPEDGEIRFHSTADTHLMSEQNLRMLVEDDWLAEVGGKHCLSIAENMLLQVEEGIDTIVNNGDYNISVDGDHNHHASGDTSIFSGNDNIIQAVNDTEMFSFTGKMDVGSQLETSIKSYEQNITIEAKKENVKLMSNEAINQLDLNAAGISLFSTTDIASRSQTNITDSVSTSYDIDSEGTPTYQDSPIGDSGCLTVDGLTIRMGSDSMFDFSGSNVRFEWDGLQTSVDTIQDSLDQIEERVNDMLWSNLLNFLNLQFLARSDDFQSYIGIGLPTSVPNPNVFFPSLDLPEFDFDFCVDMNNLIDVESFNPSPHGAFLNIRADLGGWTKQSIKQWASRQKANFDNMVNNINVADQVSNSFDTAINQIKTNISNAKNALDNLVNISLTDNGTYLADYTLGMEGFSEGLSDFNSLASGETSVEEMRDLENAINDQLRTSKSLSEIAAQDPTEINSYDFSDLQEGSDILGEILDDLSGVPS